MTKYLQIYLPIITDNYCYKLYVSIFVYCVFFYRREKTLGDIVQGEKLLEDDEYLPTYGDRKKSKIKYFIIHSIYTYCLCILHI